MGSVKLVFLTYHYWPLLSIGLLNVVPGSFVKYDTSILVRIYNNLSRGARVLFSCMSRNEDLFFLFCCSLTSFVGYCDAVLREGTCREPWPSRCTGAV